MESILDVSHRCLTQGQNVNKAKLQSPSRAASQLVKQLEEGVRGRAELIVSTEGTLQTQERLCRCELVIWDQDPLHSWIQVLQVSVSKDSV